MTDNAEMYPIVDDASQWGLENADDTVRAHMTDRGWRFIAKKQMEHKTVEVWAKGGENDRP